MKFSYAFVVGDGIQCLDKHFTHALFMIFSYGALLCSIPQNRVQRSITAQQNKFPVHDLFKISKSPHTHIFPI